MGSLDRLGQNFDCDDPQRRVSTDYCGTRW